MRVAVKVKYTQTEQEYLNCSLVSRLSWEEWKRQSQMAQVVALQILWDLAGSHIDCPVLASHLAKCNAKTALSIKHTLDKYCLASGLKVSMSKSTVFFTPKIVQPARGRMVDILGFCPTSPSRERIGCEVECDKVGFIMSDLIDSEGKWDLSRVKTSIPPEIRACILCTPPPFCRNHADSQIWEGSSNGLFSSKSAYKVLNSDSENGSVYMDKKSAVAGGLIRDQWGRWIQGFSIGLGDLTINTAELLGIREGLRMAWDRTCKKLIIETDSEYGHDSPLERKLWIEPPQELMELLDMEASCGSSC
ncbi:hypothetical protein BUALT_Bualt07G0037800 [Buddleja alternifolia]|uniref:RNase H type-1 domain-containing protein n=1 Tax=Buddleja alternifolia TaxID=168488 RepID=A0AAV6XC25_9LAMI|nr:hypothetical protein BUALT_Bualt07G0037800 [Buddleja alternifolia]